MFHFTLIQKGVLWGLFNLRIPLILISLLPPLWYFSIFHFFASSLSFLSKNRILLAVVLGLVSSLRYHLLYTQRLVSSASSLIYKVISFTECNRLRFRIVLLVVQKIGCTLRAVALTVPIIRDSSPFACTHHIVWGHKFCKTLLSSTDCLNPLSDVRQGPQA